MKQNFKPAKETSEQTHEKWVAPEATVLSTQETLNGLAPIGDGPGGELGSGSTS